jgi:hypothetical protein
MELLDNFAFVDSSGRWWIARKGLVIDGASIPRPFWRWANPFIGDFRRASVVHDQYCADGTASGFVGFFPSFLPPSHEVHEMFHDASRAGGVRATKALLMGLAVRCFGPRFEGRA